MAIIMIKTNNEYPEALFKLAYEEKCTKEVSDSLELVADLLDENPQLIDLLASPAIPMTKRLEVIQKAFGDVHKYVLYFLKILCRNSLVPTFFDCVDEYHDLLEKASNFSTAIVTSAAPLTSKEQSKLVGKLADICGHTVVIKTHVDSSIIGGIIIEIDGKVIDTSIKSRLKEVKEVMGK